MANKLITSQLSQIPKHAVVAFLLGPRVDQGALAGALRAHKANAPVSETTLLNLQRAALEKVLLSITSGSQDELEALVEDWLYRGMKSLYLHRLSGDISEIDENTLHTLTQACEEIAKNEGDDSVLLGVSDIQFVSSEEFSQPGAVVIELGYCYTTYVHVIDPETEAPRDVADLRRGFLWLCPKLGWAAICAHDIHLRDALVKALSQTIGLTFHDVRFTKDTIQSLESSKKARRMALIDTSTRVTRRYSGRGLGVDQSAQREITRRIKKDDAPNSGYDVELPDGSFMVLGYNNSQGKIFFSRDLSVTELRNWGCNKVREIIDEVRQRLISDTKLAEKITSKHVNRFPTDARPIVRELILAVAACWRDDLYEVDLGTDAFTTAETLKSRVAALPYLIDEDGEYVDLVCKNCESEEIAIRVPEKSLFCRRCKATKNRNQLRTLDGTKVQYGKLEENVMLLPTEEFNAAIFQGASEILGRPLCSESNGFIIIGNRVIVREEAGDVLVPLLSIPELAGLLKSNVPAARQKDIRNVLGDYKERCDSISTENCAGCVASRKGDKCYLRLFGLVDSAFVPRPHQGNEFGDYHREITVDGRPRQAFAIVMKSSIGKGSIDAHQITSSKKEGREILEQTIRYLRKPEMDVIGISVPNDLHPDFKYMLVDVARMHEKKLVILGADELSLLVYTAIKNHNCDLLEI